jgi:hypothetical protein
MATFQAVAALHAQPDSEWAAQHAEIAQVSANGVHFRAKSEPASAVQSAVAVMREYATEHCLVGPSLMGPLDLTVSGSPCSARTLLLLLLTRSSAFHAAMFL